MGIIVSKITIPQANQARRMREEGISWTAIGREFLCKPETIRRHIDLEWATRERERKRNNKKNQQSQKPKAPTVISHPVRGKISQLEIAAAIAKIPKDTRTSTSKWLGDPLPGRSALDQKRAAGERLIW